jgi:hypothetical protein
MHQQPLRGRTTKSIPRDDVVGCCYSPSKHNRFDGVASLLLNRRFETLPSILFAIIAFIRHGSGSIQSWFQERRLSELLPQRRPTRAIRTLLGSRFQVDLERRLTQVSENAVKIWRNAKLNKADRFDNEIIAQLKNSAILVPIVTRVTGESRQDLRTLRGSTLANCSRLTSTSSSSRKRTAPIANIICTPTPVTGWSMPRTGTT